MKQQPYLRYVLILPLILLLSTGCVREVIVEKPVPVEVPGPVEWRDIPPNLLIQHNKSTIPEALTYGEALQLWAEDRASIESLNGNIRAISSLSDAIE